MNILLVEDEVSLAMIVKDALEEEGYEVAIARDGLEGLEQYFREHPALIIADVMMPEVDGFEMVRRIRRMDKEVPVLFLSARSSVDDIVFGFGLGANDYLRKPFSLRELIARVKALTVKSLSEPVAVIYHELGLYTFYPSTQTLQIGGEEIELSFRESELLRLLCESGTLPVDTKDILLQLWGNDSFYNTRSLHVFITKLRHKLEKDPRIKILNVRGIGYKLIGGRL
ncbi:response regulator transcription factor [Parabacteroides sp. W1-Q-101]|jgi:two-component system, OmpR family, response regulator TrcR|uniref:Response regulator transcription factor n=1 Tax=Parabacteroides segnis TaxID=2763058 RepID=A0ABR7E053_9BACT|nr:MULTISPECIES: response regulator transcription factor [Parabacteroides]MBC5643145.1 response regulator transcription factor [Parabacteroides segnis]MCM0714840.1 response regulator transcription factor [Parabacteroides sp. TA-V-105]MCM0720195.1 response regulator transcription factor [Parabacteroides sp. W1-Q-101]